MSDLIAQAKAFATQAHARIDQRRKYSHQPYDVHLKAVAALVSEVAGDPHMIAAAWLHDTVEDTPATVEDIERAFGADVAQLVDELTDVSRPGDGNRAERKRLDRQHIARASVRAKTIKLADLIDNCRDICQHDSRFARVFLKEMEALLDVLHEGDERLYRRARKVWRDCHQWLSRQARQDADETLAGEAGDFGVTYEQQRALRHFTEAFKAADIADPMPSFDAATSAFAASEDMQAAGWTVAGVRDRGLVSGYLQAVDLTDGSCRDYRREFAAGQLLHADASLSDVIQVLTRYECCFVTLMGEVTGFILRGHIQRPLVRMWLFGMITIVEMNLVASLHRRFPDDAWQSMLNEERLQKARALQEERLRRGQTSRLIDCLQFSDKARLLIEDEHSLARLGFPTKGSAKRIIKALESLRNNLAHAQDIVSHDWPQIARMTRRIEGLVLWRNIEEE